ncbi:MAG: hypothetical protein ACP5G0_14365, partial [Desulfomonilia bacterium]
LKMSESPCGIRNYGPFLGEHNKSVLTEVLGHSNEYIETLYAEDVLYHEEAVDRLSGELDRMPMAAS